MIERTWVYSTIWRHGTTYDEEKIRGRISTDRLSVSDHNTRVYLMLLSFRMLGWYWNARASSFAGAGTLTLSAMPRNTSKSEDWKHALLILLAARKAETKWIYGRTRRTDDEKSTARENRLVGRKRKKGNAGRCMYTTRIASDLRQLLPFWCIWLM